MKGCTVEKLVCRSQLPLVSIMSYFEMILFVIFDCLRPAALEAWFYIYFHIVMYAHYL